jgi:hypothetical protein
MEKIGEQPPLRSQPEAQQSADRIRLLREQLATPELQRILELSPEQQLRFDEWAQAQLRELAQQFDIDTSASQKRASWGMRIASTLGGIAICAAVVLPSAGAIGRIARAEATPESELPGNPNEELPILWYVLFPLSGAY